MVFVIFGYRPGQGKPGQAIGFVDNACMGGWRPAGEPQARSRCRGWVAVSRSARARCASEKVEPECGSEEPLTPAPAV